MLKLNKEAMAEYDRDIESWRDYSSSMSTNFLAGKIEGKIEGRMEGQNEEREQRNHLFVANLLTSTSFTVSKIAALVGVPEDYVRTIKASMAE